MIFFFVALLEQGVNFNILQVFYWPFFRETALVKFDFFFEPFEVIERAYFRH